MRSRKQLCTGVYTIYPGRYPDEPRSIVSEGEKMGITGGRSKLSTLLSPAVDNFINR